MTLFISSDGASTGGQRVGLGNLHEFEVASTRRAVNSLREKGVEGTWFSRAIRTGTNLRLTPTLSIRRRITRKTREFMSTAMTWGPTNLQALTKFNGLAVKLVLLGEKDVVVMVWHEHLTEAGSHGLDALVALNPASVHVTYSDERDAAFAEAHAIALRQRGLGSLACVA
jgi:hypothetical protein